MNLEKKYVLVSNRGPDLKLNKKEHKSKGGTKGAYMSLFIKYSTNWFFILPQKYYQKDIPYKNFSPIFIEEHIYQNYYYKYISEFLYLILLGYENKNIDLKNCEEDFLTVNSIIFNHIKNYDDIILCDYHLYKIPSLLKNKNIIYYWFIPFLDLIFYKNEKIIKEVISSLKNCNKIIFLNKVYLENFKKLFHHFFPKETLKSKLIVNFLGPDINFISNKLSFTKNKVLKVGMITRLDPIKNIINTIDSFKNFSYKSNIKIEFHIIAQHHRKDSTFYQKYEEEILKKVKKIKVNE